jgi:CelD/BcsL family acetyltransferase involved in cellulose biosynthesis
MRYELMRASEVDDGLAAAWLEILDANPDFHSPYFAPHFTQAVAAVRNDAYVTVMEDGARIAGFFPFQTSARHAGRPIGGAFSDYQAVIASSDAEWDVRDLLRESRLHVWEFDHLVRWQKQFQPYHRAYSKSPLISLNGASRIITIVSGGHVRQEQAQASRRRRKLEREVGPLRFEPDLKEPGVLDRILEWKGHQFARSGASNPFCFQWTRDLLHLILNTRSPLFSGAMSALFSGDTLLAAHLGMRFKRTLHYWFPAFNREFSMYSPGIVLFSYMVENAQNQGIGVLDLGKGDEEYKRRWSNQAVPLAEGYVELPSVQALLRKTRRNAESLIRKAGLASAVKIPARIIRRIENRRRFR